MCLVVYLASDKLRLDVEWDETAPRFHVKRGDEDGRNTAIHFSKRHIHYVGSDNGCGCGFRQEHDYTIDDPDELKSKADNHRQLHAYVATCLEQEESIELYSCWSGDEASPLEHEQAVTLAELLSTSFSFLERQLTVVTEVST